MSARGLAVSFLDAYKRWLSPLLPAACRFEPTCSAYAREAIEIHGVWRGGGMTIGRLLRCQPFSRGGFDPVPGESGSAGCPSASSASASSPSTSSPSPGSGRDLHG